MRIENIRQNVGTPNTACRLPAAPPAKSGPYAMQVLHGSLGRLRLRVYETDRSTGE